MTPRRSLRSSPSSPRSPLPLRAEWESSAPPFASGLPERDPIRWRLRGSLWINCLVSPSAEPPFALELFRLHARSAAMPLAPSSREHPSPDVRVENRALPSLRQERRPLSAPGTFARSRVRRFPRPLSRPCSAAPATPDRTAFARRRRSFVVHSTKLLIHLRQSPDSAL